MNERRKTLGTPVKRGELWTWVQRSSPRTGKHSCPVQAALLLPRNSGEQSVTRCTALPREHPFPRIIAWYNFHIILLWENTRHVCTPRSLELRLPAEEALHEFMWNMACVGAGSGTRSGQGGLHSYWVRFALSSQQRLLLGSWGAEHPDSASMLCPGLSIFLHTLLDDRMDGGIQGLTPEQPRLRLINLQSSPPLF